MRYLCIVLTLTFLMAACSKTDGKAEEKNGGGQGQGPGSEAKQAPAGEEKKAEAPAAEEKKAEAPAAEEKKAEDGKPEDKPVDGDEALWRQACEQMAVIGLAEAEKATMGEWKAPGPEELARQKEACFKGLAEGPTPDMANMFAKCALKAKTGGDMQACTEKVAEAEAKKLAPIADPGAKPKVEEGLIADSLEGTPVVLVETNMGNFKVQLTPDKTPVTVENFLKYVQDDFYTGTVFHRVVPGFVIQGGGFSEDLAQRPVREPIINEAATAIPNDRGTICMARTPARNSATSQFYVNLKNNTMLNYRGETPSGWGYCAFGTVIEGMEVVDAIGSVYTGASGHFKKDVPLDPIIIKKISLVK